MTPKKNYACEAPQKDLKTHQTQETTELQREKIRSKPGQAFYEKRNTELCLRTHRS
jgi:hypothetical protein